MQEVLDSISSFQPAKSPGSDGLPIEFYKEYAEFLAIYLVAFQCEELPESKREAVIVVLPKLGKDPLLCESYRPISLLQADIKILAKILAKRTRSSYPYTSRPDWLYAWKVHRPKFAKIIYEHPGCT